MFMSVIATAVFLHYKATLLNYLVAIKQYDTEGLLFFNYRV
jgi:hypothetical protein